MQHLYHTKLIANPTPAEAFQKHVNALMINFQHKSIQFHFIFLGIGDNLQPASTSSKYFNIGRNGSHSYLDILENMEVYRITVTAPLLIQAKILSFSVFEKYKLEVIYTVLKVKMKSLKQYHARLINSKIKKMVWELDTFATLRL